MNPSVKQALDHLAKKLATYQPQRKQKKATEKKGAKRKAK